MNKVWKTMLAVMLTITSIIGNLRITSVAAAEVKDGEYPVSADVFVRSDGSNANKNFNYEEIKPEVHGNQYAGKNYKVLNTKNYPGSTDKHLTTVMKLPLPSQDEVADNHYDTFEFVFHIFKNADYKKGPQTFQFFYTKNVDWKENEITWNNKPAEIKPDAQDLLFDFTIPADKEYEFLNDAEKTIRVDVSEKIQSLIDEGVTEITIFTFGKDKKDTSLIIHSRESGDGSYTAKLVASNNDETYASLQALVAECKKITADGYTSDSYQKLQDGITLAESALTSGDKDQVAQAYAQLSAAKSALLVSYPVLEDAYIRSDKGNEIRSNEEITSLHNPKDKPGLYDGKNYRVINVKRYPNNREIISVMKFNVPTLQWLNEHDLDSYFLEFNVFKNPDYNRGDQTYHFYYTNEVNWSETSLTWNTKPASIKHDGEHLLADFTIKQGDEYEFKNEAQKHIKLDISEKLKEIAQSGYTTITVFAVADKGMETSLMLHSKESADGSLGAQISGAYLNYAAKLNALITECKGLDEAAYAKEGMDALKTVLAQAEAMDETAGGLDIHIMYERLLKAQQNLVSIADPADSANIAYQKPTRTNLSKGTADRVTDGDLGTTWTGTFYPSYVDIDLLDTYDLSGMKLFTPAGKKVNYTIYGSNDGTNYDRLYQKRDLSAMSADGDTITFDQTYSYRIIRVYMEYTQGENSAYLSEVRVYGTPTQSNEDDLKQGSLEDILNVTSYEDSAYAQAISDQETIENVYGIIDRTIGAQYRNWFSFELSKDNSDKDWYEISDQGGKIHIKGNEGLSLTTGLNYYYKNYLNVHISEQTKQVSMPNAIVKVNDTIRKETPYQVRYAFNYCTLSYTFAFFGQEEWQRENDWLALNGVNVVLDLAGQEATWIKFLMNFGYSYDDAKDWLTGPAYYAWQFMDNMEVFGGPIPDGYVKDRLEMARASQRWKRSLGMQTILQGYAGMVPTNFNEYQPSVQLIGQGGWNGFTRPSMIATDSVTYDEYARLFYEAQEFVYGPTSDYYAVDPFHEGGKRPSGLSDSTIADEVLNSMLEYDQDAVWVVQGWQSNPTNALLNGMGNRREDHVLVVDLIKYPIASWTKYNKTSYGSTQLDAKEFNGTSWAWGLLANFGGNPSMHGQMEVMVNDIMNARKTSSHMVGLGIISEAQYDNPVMYDLIFDLAWADESFDLDTWLNGYINRRYGGTSENARMAWQIMKDSNYNHGVRYTNELFGMKSTTPQSYGKQSIPYGAENLESALRLLLEDFDKFKNSECYLYDITEMMRQHVSNYAVLKYNEVLDARSPDTVEEFKKLKDEFLNAFNVLNEVASTQQEQLGGEWIGKARDRAADYDDFAEDSFEMGAKALITSWGSRGAHGSLKDYGWRNYEGIFKDLNTNIWSEYLNRVADNLENGLAVTNGNLDKNGYFDMYWKWNLTKQNYTRTAKDSAPEIKAISERVLEECAISGELDPNIGNIALPGLPEITQGEGSDDIYAINDGDADTTLEVQGDQAEAIIDLIGEFQLSKINVVTDALSSGYSVSISNDKQSWTTIASEASGSQDASGITYPITDAIARYIKISANGNDHPLQIKEVRAYGERLLPTLEQLQTLIGFSNTINTDNVKQEAVGAYQSALADAVLAYNHGANPDEAYTTYWALYDAIVALDLKTLPNLALHKRVVAHNDPSGNSDCLTDGSTDTHWNAGRLSATGKPYESTITPGWAIVDLEDIYDITQIEVLFNGNIWHHYEVYISEDNQTWTKVGEKKTNALPGAEDNYSLEDVKARYVKLYLTDVQLESNGSGKRNSVGVKELIVRGKKITIEKDDLLTAISQAEALDETLYSDAGWSALAQALTTAKTIADAKTSTQKEVDEACKALTDAIAGLVYKPANYTKVDGQIRKANALTKDDYVDFSAVDDALAAVVRGKDIREQAKVDDMASAIETAIAGLRKKATAIDKNELAKAIKEAQSLHEDEYTADSWKKMTDVLADATALIQQDPVAQNDVIAATTALKDAVNELRKKDIGDDAGYHTVIKDHISVSGKMEDDITLHVIDMAQKTPSLFQTMQIRAYAYDKAFFKDKELMSIYDIKLLKNNVEYHAEGDLYVRVQLLPQWNGKNLQVIYIKDDGSFETINSTVVNNELCFSVKHFSYYGIVASKQNSNEQPGISQPQQPDTNAGITGADTGNSIHLGWYVLMITISGYALAQYLKRRYIKEWQ